MTADELEQIEDENDVRRERSSSDPVAVREIDRLVAEVKRLQHELQIKLECEIDLTNELDTSAQ